MNGKVLWSVFWRTFAALALPVVIAVQTMEWADKELFAANSVIIALGLVGAFVGAIVAVLMAMGLGFAETPLGKALRALVQSIAQVLSGLGFASLADLSNNVDLLVAGIPVVIGAFLVAFFQNQGPPPQLPQSAKPALKDAFSKA